MSSTQRVCFAMLLSLLAMPAICADENLVSSQAGPERRDVQELKVAVAQPLVVPGAVHTNVRNMEPLIVEAVRRDARVVVFSECAITGYDLKGVGAKAAVTPESPVLQDVADMAKRHDVVIVAGFHERQGDDLYNSAGVFYPDGRRLIQRKHAILKPERSVTPITPGQCVLVNDQGQQVPCQIDGDVLSFVAAVPQGGSATYTLRSQSGGAGPSALTARVQGQTLVIRNQQLALQVPAPAEIVHAAPIEASQVTSPILKWSGAVDGVNLECPSYALYSPFRTLNISQNILRNRGFHNFGPDGYHAPFLQWLSHLTMADPRYDDQGRVRR